MAALRGRKASGEVGLRRPFLLQIHRADEDAKGEAEWLFLMSPLVS